MKNRYLAILLVIAIVAICSISLVACGNDPLTDDLTELAITGIDGYADAVIDKENKTISLKTTEDKFDRSKISVPSSFTIDIFSDEDHKTKVDGDIPTLLRENVYYISFICKDKTELNQDWKIVITKDVAIENIKPDGHWKDMYEFGESYNLNEKLHVTYANGEEEIVDITAEMVNGFNSNTLGDKKLTITYNGATYSHDYIVIANNGVMGMRFDYPIGTTTLEGVINIPINGTIKSIDLAEQEVQDLNPNKIGLQHVSVTVDGVKVPLSIRINQTNYNDVKPIERTEINTLDIYNIAKIMYATVVSMSTKGTAYDNGLAEFDYIKETPTANKYNINEELTAIETVLETSGITGEQLTAFFNANKKDIQSLTIFAIDLFDKISYADNPFAVIGDTLKVEHVEALRNVLNNAVESITPNQLATGVYCLGIMSIFGENGHSLNYGQNATAQQYFDALEKVIQSANPIKDTTSFNKLEFVVDKGSKALLNALNAVDAQELLDAYEIGINIMNYLMDNSNFEMQNFINTYSVKDLLKYIKSLGVALETFVNTLDGDINLIIPFATDLWFNGASLNNSDFSYDEYLNEFTAISRTAYIVPHILKGLDADSVTRILLDIDASMKAETEGAANNATAYLVLDCGITAGKIYEHLDAIYKNDIKIAMATITDLFEIRSDVMDTALDFYTKLKTYDRENLSDADITEILTKFHEVNNAFNGHVTTNYLYVSGQSIDLKLGAEIDAGFKQMVEMQLNAKFVETTQSGENRIPIDKKDLDIDYSRIDTNKPGYQPIVISYTYKNVVYQDYIDVFVIPTDMKETVYNITTFAKPIKLAQSDTGAIEVLKIESGNTNQNNILVSYSSPKYRFAKTYTISVASLNTQNSEYTLIDVDTTELCHKKYGYIKIVDKYIGDIYVNVPYSVIPASWDGTTKTNVTSYIQESYDNGAPYYVNDWKSAFTNASADDLLKLKAAFEPEIDFVAIYDGFIYDRNERIMVNCTDLNMDNLKPGLNDLTYTDPQGIVYKYQLNVITFKEYKKLFSLSLYNSWTDEDYVVGDNKLNNILNAKVELCTKQSLRSIDLATAKLLAPALGYTISATSDIVDINTPGVYHASCTLTNQFGRVIDRLDKTINVYSREDAKYILIALKNATNSMYMTEEIMQSLMANDFTFLFNDSCIVQAVNMLEEQVNLDDIKTNTSKYLKFKCVLTSESARITILNNIDDVLLVLNINRANANPDNKPHGPNIDHNEDKFPEGKPDSNVDKFPEGKPDSNSDKYPEGKPDSNSDKFPEGKPDSNVDKFPEGKPDMKK